MGQTMSRLDDLPPDQRAVLSLLLAQRKTYAEVATLLQISERAVQVRAHGALDTLVDPSALDASGELPAQQRADIGDYLLGQQSTVAERLRTRTRLDGSQPARGWAGALVAELQPLAAEPLPEIPAGPPQAATAGAPPPAQPPVAPPSAAQTPPSREPAPAATRALPSSRLGGALLLTAIITGIIVAVVLSSGSGGGSSSPTTATSTTSASTPSGPTQTSPASTSATSTSATKTGTGPSEQARLALTSPDPGSKTIGVAVILAEGHQHAFYLAAERVPPSKGFFYGVWLYNSPSNFLALGKAPPVGADGRMQGGALLPPNAASFHTMIVTRETEQKPAHPGPVVLRGSFKLH
jgi:Sigma-70, region 4